MVRSVRIKEVRFAAQTPTSGTSATFYSDHAVNGEILKVEVQTNSTGSVWIGASGTGEEVWRNNAPSGTALGVSHPFVYGNDPTDVTGSPSAVFSPVMQDVLFWAGSGFEGGSVTHLVVKYR